MYDKEFGTRVKSWDQDLGFMPLWRRMKDTHNLAFERNEITDLGTRYEREGNVLWSRVWGWGLNRKGWLQVEDSNPEMVYECVFERTVSVLGFYWRDRRNQELEYKTEAELPKDQCHRIAMPAIGSEIL